jgi:putative CocE/NonD family hydrolase
MVRITRGGSKDFAPTFLLWLAFLSCSPTAGQTLPFTPDTAAGPDAVAAQMAKLAQRVVAEYKEPDRTKYLANMSRAQLVAGEYTAAAASIDSLMAAPLPDAPDLIDRLAPFQLVAMARADQAGSGGSFEDAFRRVFRSKIGALDDKTALREIYWFNSNADSAKTDFQASFAGKKGKREIALPDAMDLIRQYSSFTVYRDIQPLTQALIAEDANRRYRIDDDIFIKTRDGATISAIIVRPKNASGRLPAAFTFTIYASTSVPDATKRAAAYGYVGVIAFTRGKRLSPDEPVPYEHDGADAREVIDWIVKQPWSDGRVGMFGGSYNGFTQWAAAKQPHTALKTIVPYVAAIPGQGLPMENNVFLNANYGWAFYVTDNQYLDDKVYADPARWSSLNTKWFASGRPYREIDQVDGTPNKWLQRWLNHPSFDKYWQDMVPFQSDFAKINIPVLTITGYYDDGQISALQYLKDHYKYNGHANHYLLIGPWDHPGSQASRKQAVLRGYSIDPVAQVDTPDITFQWFDYVFRGGKKPELLKDRINYEQMGSNTWKHASSLESMHNDVLTLYLTTEEDRPYRRLSQTKPAKAAFLTQTVDLADRKTQTNDYYPAPIVGKKIGLSSRFAFISEPMPTRVSVDGTLSGQLTAQINKRDMDVGVVLYEVMPNGELFHLTYFIGRASYAKDMTVRHLLTPGKIESIPFDRTRMVSRQLEKGSRLLVVLDVNKSRFTQVNYGTGKDVSDESIADAGTPLEVKWRNDSYVRIPISK